MATVARLRARMLKSLCSQTSPNSTSSLSCPSSRMNPYTVGFLAIFDLLCLRSMVGSRRRRTLTAFVDRRSVMQEGAYAIDVPGEQTTRRWTRAADPPALEALRPYADIREVSGDSVGSDSVI